MYKVYIAKPIFEIGLLYNGRYTHDNKTQRDNHMENVNHHCR